MKLLTFSIIALFITLPWFLHPGYLLFLDWAGVPTPTIQLDATGGIAGMPIQILWVIVSKITSSEFAQKLLIFFMLVLAGTTTYQLAQFLTKKSIASLCAGIFMMTNAFVFNRLQMGHIYLLYGYALTPYAIYLVLRFLQHPSNKQALLASIGCSAVILLSIHHIILLPILIALFAWHTYKKQPYPKQQFIALLGPYLITMLAILVIIYHTPASSLATLSPQDIVVFAPHPECTHSLALDTVFLSSSWRNPQAIPLPCSHKTIFYASSIILFGIMMLGAWKNKKLFIGAIILIILTDVPFILAMRDSAKYISDLALIEAILIAYGIINISKKIPYNIASSFILLVTLIAGMNMFWGLSNTISPQQYPQGWYQFNNKLAQVSQKPNILFLPWHLYMPFDFTNGQTIGNPAKLFFTNAHITQGDNLEINQNGHFISTKSSSLVSRAVEHVLSTRNTPDFASNLKTLLINQHISYIVLAHGSPEEAEYQSLLTPLPYLHKTLNSTGLTVWQFGE